MPTCYIPPCALQWLRVITDLITFGNDTHNETIGCIINCNNSKDILAGAITQKLGDEC